MSDDSLPPSVIERKIDILLDWTSTILALFVSSAIAFVMWNYSHGDFGEASSFWAGSLVLAFALLRLQLSRARRG